MRLAILTVGKTHSGKTTFARALQQRLPNLVVVDRDLQAEFINAHYALLAPTSEPNRIKAALTDAILTHAIEHTAFHIALASSNREKSERLRQIRSFRAAGFRTVLVVFRVSDDVLEMRVRESSRSTKPLRTSSNFHEVLLRQQKESQRAEFAPPSGDEADYLLEMYGSAGADQVIEQIVGLLPQ